MITNDSTEVTEDSQPAAGPSSRPRSGNSALIFTLLMALGTMALYNPAIRNDFQTYDDPIYVYLNPVVTTGLSWANIGWAFTTTTFANWHPLTWISHMTAWQIFGSNPMGHHLTNVFLHTLNVVLLFILLRRTTGHTGRSALVAALFAVHPLNVESVAWVSERKGLLCMFFVMLTLLAYVRYARRPAVRQYLWVIVFFALALMAKPLAITLPFLLLLLDLWPLERLSLPGAPPPGPDSELPPVTIGRLLGEKAVLALMSAASAVITMFAQRGSGATGALSEVPVIFRIGNAIYSYFRYVAKGVWPADLAAFYPHPERSLAWWKVALAGAALLLITGAVWKWRRQKYLTAGWLWYLAALAPMAGFIQVGRQAMADRYAYLPLIGVFIAVVWLAADLTERSVVARRAALAVSVVALCGFAWRTHEEIGYWRNTETLFTRSMEVNGPNYIAEDYLTWTFDITGHPDRALPHGLNAVRLAPDVGSIHSRLADVFFHLGRLDEAIEEYRRALAAPMHSAPELWVRSQLGLSLARRNRLDEALTEFTAAIRMAPEKPAAYFNRGSIEYQRGQFDAAAADFTRSLQIEPNPVVYYWMGRAMEEKHDLRAAATAYQYALRGGQEIADARARLAAVQAKLVP